MPDETRQKEGEREGRETLAEKKQRKEKEDWENAILKARALQERCGNSCIESPYTVENGEKGLAVLFREQIPQMSRSISMRIARETVNTLPLVSFYAIRFSPVILCRFFTGQFHGDCQLGISLGNSALGRGFSSRRFETRSRRQAVCIGASL